MIGFLLLAEAGSFALAHVAIPAAVFAACAFVAAIAGRTPHANNAARVDYESHGSE